MYLQPKAKPSDDVWYFDKPIGINTIHGNNKRMCKMAGIDTQNLNLRNHLLRDATGTCLFQCNVDEQLIKQITRHASNVVRF